MFGPARKKAESSSEGDAVTDGGSAKLENDSDMNAWKRSRSGAGRFRFRVSDAVEVPLRGWLLRLRLVDGQASAGALAIGRKLRLTSPSGNERVVTITAHAVTGGRQTQARLDRTREMDVMIEREDAGSDATRVDIGWMALGPVSDA